MTRRILITGSRTWSNFGAISMALTRELRATEDRALTIVHGGAPGADLLADRWARQDWTWAEVKPERHDAKWEDSCGPDCWKHRKPAKWPQGTDYCPKQGHIRNQLMVDLGADVCLAFPSTASIGTWDCMRRAEAAGIRVVNLGYSKGGV